LTDIRVHDRNTQLDTSQMYESSVLVRELVLQRRLRREAVTEAQTALLRAAHREYEAGNIARARQLYRACLPALGRDGLRRYAVSLLPASLRNLARAIWWGVHAKETGAPVAKSRATS